MTTKALQEHTTDTIQPFSKKQINKRLKNVLKLNNAETVQVCDATKYHSCTAAGSIKKTAQIIMVLLICFCTSLSLFAQKFTTSVSATTIGKNQYVEVSYEMADVSNIENFQLPQFKDWIVISGPANSSYQSNINGQVSRKTTLSYYLQPKRTGQLEVEGASAIMNGKTVTSANKTVQVVEKNVQDQSSGSNAQPVDPFGNLLQDPFFAQPPTVQAAPREDVFADAMVLRANENVPEKIKNNLFIKVIPSKSTCYEGEPITATYKVYTRLDMDANVTRRPSFSGFSAYDMEEPNQPYVVETINGKKYKSWVIRKVQLYPLQSGTLSLDPVEVDCNINFIKAESVARGGFDPYAQENFTKVQYTLKSPAINITAQPLPAEGRPKDFHGAVGTFNIKASVNDNTLGKDDATHLVVNVSGSGNFSMVHAPDITWPAKAEAYEPKTSENLSKAEVPITGSKLFDYVFLTHQAGKYVVPAVTFSYFDIDSKSYKTISTQPITLQVSATSKQQSLLSDENGQNLPFLFSRIATVLLPSLAIGLLIFLIVSSFRRRKVKQHQEQQSAAVRAAWQRLVQESEQNTSAQNAPSTTSNSISADDNNKAYMPAILVNNEPESSTIMKEENKDDVARETDPLPALQAETLIWIDDHRLFYKALKNDVLQSLATLTKHNSTNKNELLEKAKTKGTEIEVVQQLNALMDECDAALYSPVSAATDRQKMLEEAKFLLQKV